RKARSPRIASPRTACCALRPNRRAFRRNVPNGATYTSPTRYVQLRTAPSVTNRSEPRRMSNRTIPLRTKILYAVGDVATNIKNASMTRFPLFFYADILKVSRAAVGLVLFVGRAWDAITDPAMGYVSDTTRSRWGRRRPYVMLSA